MDDYWGVNAYTNIYAHRYKSDRKCYISAYQIQPQFFGHPEDFVEDTFPRRQLFYWTRKEVIAKQDSYHPITSAYITWLYICNMLMFVCKRTFVGVCSKWRTDDERHEKILLITIIVSQRLTLNLNGWINLQFVVEHQTAPMCFFGAINTCNSLKLHLSCKESSELKDIALFIQRIINKIADATR